MPAQEYTAVDIGVSWHSHPLVEILHQRVLGIGG